MIRKAFIVLVVLQGACSSTGPDRPESYHGPAFTLNARFVDLPMGEISSAEVDLSAVDYGALRDDQQSEVRQVYVEALSLSPLVGASAQLDFAAVAGILPQLQEGTFYGELRFFRLTAELQVPIGPDQWSFIGPWSPRGYDLVHAQIPATFSPYGPSGPAVTFPKGYSWLRRTCGTAPGMIEMTVVSTDEAVDFYDVEVSDQALAEGCGAIVPAADLGTRISFDRAQSLVWSADGGSIYYVAPADPQDPSQSVSLRQLQLADAATSEVIVIPLGQGLQSDSTGQLYIGNGGNLFRVDTSSTPAALVSIPIRSDAVLSSDGRWLAYYASTPGVNGVRVWDIQSDADLTSVDGSFLGWSPDSRLAYLSWSATPTFNVLSPAALGQPMTYGTIGNSSPTVVWSAGGPLLAQRPFDWSIQSGYIPACSACFGLNLQDPVSGTTRPVLDASAGMIDIVPTPPVLGFMLVWARTCLGLYNTVCSYSLIRVDLTDATARTVAVSASELPVAVSPDYRRVAIAASSGIYVKSLTQ
jgi:hypothetical protein